ncbi:unnamed protein product [Leptidea sinapis]|uniref:Death domain-containing protein n=1 Tax=Leptidea sinapis TaxID=189913 RepID=A0A5E4R497_9NEOP|nr:unnamed protein product [Leptidea sinapis]
MDLLRNYENADTISIDTLSLEELVQEERAKEILELNRLSEKVCYLHTSLVYYRNANSKMGQTCYQVWKTLLQRVGGSPNTWNILGHTLGISLVDLEYIKNSVKEDPVDMILKVFMQDDNATLDKIINAFVKLERFDILKALEEPLNNMSECFTREDSGYQSESGKGKREVITFPKILQVHLPPALSKKYVENYKPKEPSLRPSINWEKSKPQKECPVLFLTYTEDGLETALNIQGYVSNWVDSPQVKVLTLNGKREEVVQHPEKFIRENFEKADFVVPIITTGYLEIIKSHAPQVPSSNDNLDYKYVNFIYNLIVNHYIHATGCLNEKVRSVLPQDANVDVLRSISMYPDLMPWTYETNFDEHFKSFLFIE